MCTHCWDSIWTSTATVSRHWLSPANDAEVRTGQLSDTQATHDNDRLLSAQDMAWSVLGWQQSGSHFGEDPSGSAHAQVHEGRERYGVTDGTSKQLAKKTHTRARLQPRRHKPFPDPVLLIKGYILAINYPHTTWSLGQTLIPADCTVEQSPVNTSE